MHLAVACPSLGSPDPITIHSIQTVTNAALERGWKVIDLSDFKGDTIARKRNRITTKMMRAGCDAVLMIDGDAGIDASDVMHWIDSQLDIVAAPRPNKAINWDEVTAAFERGIRGVELAKFASTLSFITLEGEDHIIRDDTSGQHFIEVANVPTHTMLVRRHVFEKILAATNGTLSYSTGGNDTEEEHYGFFQERVELASSFAYASAERPERALISEDYFFVGLARATGAKVWVHLEVRSRHVGRFVYEGRLMDRMKKNDG